MAYISIRIDEGAAEILNRKCAELGLTKSQVVVRGCGALGSDTLSQLDKQAEIAVSDNDRRRSTLDDDELPECCQGIYSGRAEDRCPDWVLRNGRWFNTVTNKYADDPAYVNYFQNM